MVTDANAFEEHVSTQTVRYVKNEPLSLRAYPDPPPRRTMAIRMPQ